MSIPTGVSRLEASPTTSRARSLLQGVQVATRSRETSRSASAEVRRADRELALALSVTDEAAWAYADLNHALLLAHERAQEVPCQGRGGEAWTSEEYDDQQVAADRCLDCPAMAMCERYRAVARPAAGTWAGVTSDPARKPRDPKRPDRVRPLMRNGAECLCSCGGRPRRGRYLPGHDSTHVRALREEVLSGRLSRDRALGELARSERLQAKLTRFLDGR